MRYSLIWHGDSNTFYNGIFEANMWDLQVVNQPLNGVTFSQVIKDTGFKKMSV